MTGSEGQAGSTEGKVKMKLEVEKIVLRFASLVDPNCNSKQHLD